MGFLSKLFGVEHREATNRPYRTMGTNVSTPMRVRERPVPASETVILEGDFERDVYVYDGRPLSSTRKGSSFYLDVVPYDITIESVATGTVCDTKEGNDIALSYKGLVVGVLPYATGTIKKASKEGVDFKLRIKRNGMYMPGVPDLTTALPQPKLVDAWWSYRVRTGNKIPFNEEHLEEIESLAQKESERRYIEKAFSVKFTSDCEHVTLNVDDDDWNGSKAAPDFTLTDVTTELVPTPKGSSAKPHIAIFCDGRLATELSARSTRYKTLSRHVGEAPIAAASQRFDSMNEDGGYYWKLIIVYESE